MAILANGEMARSDGLGTARDRQLRVCGARHAYHVDNGSDSIDTPVRFGFRKGGSMQRHWVSVVLAVPVSLLSFVSVLAQGAQPPQIRIETVYPRHVARGHTTVINVAVPSRDLVQAAEILPPAGGVTVAGLKGAGSETEQAIGWWEVTLNVATDASPGDRSLVLVMRMGRTAPTTISVPTHVPTISDLRIMPPQTNQPTELRLAAVDAAGDLGESPYVWFSVGCDREPLVVGAVRGTVTADVIRAVLPDLRNANGGRTSAGSCELQVRVTDSTGIDSNTLKTAALALRK